MNGFVEMVIAGLFLVISLIVVTEVHGVTQLFIILLINSLAFHFAHTILDMNFNRSCTFLKASFVIALTCLTAKHSCNASLSMRTLISFEFVVSFVPLRGPAQNDIEGVHRWNTNEDAAEIFVGDPVDGVHR